MNDTLLGIVMREKYLGLQRHFNSGIGIAQSKFWPCSAIQLSVNEKVLTEWLKKNRLQVTGGSSEIKSRIDFTIIYSKKMNLLPFYGWIQHFLHKSELQNC